MTARTRQPVEIESPWMTVDEAAAYARIDRDGLSRVLRSGELVGHRRGERGRWRIHRDELDAWIRGEIGAA